MAYDALAESVRLIENGVPGWVASRVSRRVRHIPLADRRTPDLTALDEAGAVLAAADVSAWPGMGPRVRLPAIYTDDVHD